MTRAASLSELTLDHAEQAWNVLAEHLERFVNQWEAGGDPPVLASYLPAGPEALRRLTLVELVKVDLEYRWLHRNLPRPLADYLEDFPELNTERVPPDLIYEEIHIRRKAGDSAPVDQYMTRFSNQAPELSRLLAMGDGAGSTLVYHGSPTAGPIEPGEKIDDFELLTLLGKGAFASVFLARQTSMSRLVALKISTDRSSEPQTLAQLDHAGIVRVYDQRQVPERNLRLLYMQFLPGGSLADVLKAMRETPPQGWTGRLFLSVVDQELDRRGLAPPESSLRPRLATMTWPEVVCWLGARLAAALAYAEKQGVLHRDVKPANILLSGEGAPKLVDFNISFCSKVEGASPAAYFGGSLAYMSPEQLEAFNPQHSRKPDSLDGRADLYSLAALLWELLTGERPFGQERIGADWQKTLEAMTESRRAGVDPEAVELLPRNTPEGLRAALLATLSPDVDDRPRNGDELSQWFALGIDQEAQRLLYPPKKSWARLARVWSFLAIMLATLMPNALAGKFNYDFNVAEIVRKMPQATYNTFETVQLVVNGICYPLGVGLVIFVAGPVCLAAAQAGRKREQSAAMTERADLLRRRSLQLGHVAAATCLALWIIAGITYPTAINLISDAPLSSKDSLYFVLTLALCGLVGAAFPFLLITSYSTRYIYPALLHDRPPPDEDASALNWLVAWSKFYSLLTTLVPFFGAMLWALDAARNRDILTVMLTGSITGVFIAFFCSRNIETDVHALLRMGKRDATV